MTTNGKFYESEFEQAVVQLLTAEGWTHSCGEELTGRLLTEPLYTPDLHQYLQASYGLCDADTESLIARLRNESATTDYLAARAVWQLVVDGDNFLPQGESENIHIQYVDFEHPQNNIFRCVNQYEMHQGTENRRPDIVLMVNGIPLCIIELKNPTDKTADIGEAHDQICRTYREAIPVLMKYTAIAVISDGANTRMGSQFTPFEYFYAWKKVNARDDAGRPGLDQLQTMISGALAPSRLIDIYRDYIFFPDTDSQDKELEIVCRYPQYFATGLLLDSIKRAMRRRGGNGQGGTYFGATGCGKTYTMLFLARQLMRRSQQDMDSPTVLIIVDRTDLQDQSEDVFTSAKDFLGDINLKVFDSRTSLENELRDRKGGGLYITTIQKFTESTGLLSPRDNIICMSDEAHRSQTNIGERLKINSSDRDRHHHPLHRRPSLLQAKALRTPPNRQQPPRQIHLRAQDNRNHDEPLLNIQIKTSRNITLNSIRLIKCTFPLQQPIIGCIRNGFADVVHLQAGEELAFVGFYCVDGFAEAVGDFGHHLHTQSL